MRPTASFLSVSSNSSITPAAASSTPSPSGSATCRSTSWRARSASSVMSPPRKKSGFSRPSTTFRSVTETVSRPPSGQQTPMFEPAESGPSSGRLEFGLTRTKEPVPAPIESIFTSGMFSTKRAMSGVGVISKRPSVISAMSKLVPPMSVQSTLGSSIRSASAWPPTTPPIGPETSVRASSFASIEIVPPWAAITRSSKPASCSRVTSRTFWSVPRLGSAAYASISVELSRGRSRRSG